MGLPLASLALRGRRCCDAAMLRVAQLKGNYPISGVFIMILTYEEYLAWRRQSLSTDDWREQD